MTETKCDRIVKRGRIFPEIQWSEEEKAEWKAELAGISERCQLVFQRVQPELIKTHYNWVTNRKSDKLYRFYEPIDS
ncbi:hypothetical protein ACE1B6_02285 [Aerosakkonemataceae cyanobacterium BLCC-F154]|uniref:Uncharacterized protein n=1 Tax=Floridaenema fluviatile BLCC-F154 TaxID=3153640 RepID=A0ABV4Y5Q4_9CYAN